MRKTIHDIALLLKTPAEGATRLRESVSDIVLHGHLDGHRGLLIGRHPPHEYGVRWDKLYSAIQYLRGQDQDPSPDNLAEHIGPILRRKHFEPEGDIKKTGFKQGDRKYIPVAPIRVVQGGGVGVAGKHSKRSRGVKR